MRRTEVMIILLTQLVSGSVVASERYVRTNGSEPVVRDHATGLVWQGCEAGLRGGACNEPDTATPDAMNWQDALVYCASLVWAGRSDWELPAAKELRSIVDNRQSYSSVDREAFPATTSSAFWTSSTLASYPSAGWSVDFSYGIVSIYDPYASSLHVRCVRRGP